MDRSTKERLTGAIVLVAVAWLVIPVFLDGPGQRPETIRQTVDLPGRDNQEMRTKTIVLNPEPRPVESGTKVNDAPPAARKLPAPEPIPVDAERQESKRAVQEPDEESAARAAEDEAEVAATASDPEPSAGRPSVASLWAVQLGSFSRQANAEGLAADLRKQGFAAFLSRVDSDGDELHRVRVGPLASREEALEIAARLKSSGHDGQIVTHP